MGQKVHPLGFRVGITKKHQSQWFARFNKHKYAQSVLEDLMLRKTLTNLFPNLLNPIFKKVQKRDDESGLTPRITQIKIERGLIPYEIGIQIHAENCELIKSSIENLKPGHDLVCKLQKTRHYLQYLRSNLENYQTISESLNLTADNKKAASQKLPFEASGSVVNQSTTQLKKTKEADRKWEKGIHVENLFKKGTFNTKKKRFDNKSKSAFSKSQLRRQRLILKRLKKRQFIKLRYKLLINKGLLLTKKGNKVIQKINSAWRDAKSLISCVFGASAQEGVLRERTPASPPAKKRDESFISTKQANLDQKKGGASAFGARTVLAQKDLFFTKKKGGLNKTKTPLLSKQTGSIMISNNTRVAPSLSAQRDEFAFGERSKNYVSFNVFKSRIKKKFVSIFLNRMNKKFLQVLKISLIEASKRSTAMYTPLGWSKKWDFNLVKKSLGLKSLKMLTKLISVLEQKLLNKMESLRNEFLTFGSITNASSLRYYQMLTFLKQLKEYVSQLKRKQKFQKHFNKLSSEGTSSFNEGFSFASLREGGAPLVHESLIKKSNLQNLNNKVDTHTVMFYVLSKKLNNIENECRKMKFIEYLKQLIKKHRSENIYYYLTTIAEARQDLRKLKKFIQNHASFLFGLNLTNSNVQDTNNAVASLHEGNRGVVKERLHNVLAKNAVKLELEKTLQDIFLEQIDKQRNMYIENAQLIPKIALKFYSVNTKSLKAKASIVANSVVDALEKRKAFRKVIKDAKEELMRTQGVKGVKIQVSGRLNGAEIARSEWVRAGRVPLQTLRANLDYSYKTANTIYGIIGVKVWIFKGYIKLI